MRLRKDTKGGIDYYQAGHYKGKRFIVEEHLVTIEKIVEVIRNHKKKGNAVEKDVCTTKTDFKL